MARLNLTLPDDLDELVRTQLPGVNYSEVLREGLRARLRCDHDELVCVRCGHGLERRAMVDNQLSLFYADAMDALEPFAIRPGATAEGAARVLKSVGVSHGIKAAERRPLPRPTRAEREAAKVHELDVA